MIQYFDNIYTSNGFVVSIKDIGDATFEFAVYVNNARSSRGFKTDRYSSAIDKAKEEQIHIATIIERGSIE